MRGWLLAQAEFPDETMYPRLIPEKSELATQITLDVQNSTLHGGATQTIAHIRTRFWIPGCRHQVRKLILNLSQMSSVDIALVNKCFYKSFLVTKLRNKRCS